MARRPKVELEDHERDWLMVITAIVKRDGMASVSQDSVVNGDSDLTVNGVTMTVNEWYEEVRR